MLGVLEKPLMELLRAKTKRMQKPELAIIFIF
jgi:hypothetical protein